MGPPFPPPVKAYSAPGASKFLQFTRSFRVGREEGCDVCVENEYVSRSHVEVFFENGQWWVRDLNSSNGTFVNGHRIERVPLETALTVRLGIRGPELKFEVEAPSASKQPSGGETIVARYVDHYFGKSAPDQAAGEHTMYVRRAFAQVQTRQKRKYSWMLMALAFVVLGVGGYAVYLQQQVQRQKSVAKDLFYAMKTLDLDIANLQSALVESKGPRAAEIIQKEAGRRKALQTDYDRFLAGLHVYDRKMTEQQRIMLRVARIFGECELEMPKDFESEVMKYIKMWQGSDRLSTAIRTAQENGYVDLISKELLAQGLPPQFFYLALQESNFDPYASGPPTRAGIAKGMWQFVPQTALKYGLRLGPLVELRRPDPGDERDQYPKATKAAAKYLKDLYSTDAQASGILVMACYNWGENQVLPLVRSMPANPRDRNFWRLLTRHRDAIPKETYDYVFYIVSAAVIGENPHLFGFDFGNPLAGLEQLADNTVYR